MKQFFCYACLAAVVVIVTGCQDEILLGEYNADSGTTDPNFAFAPPIGNYGSSGQYWYIGICARQGIIDVDFYGTTPIDIVVLNPDNFLAFADGGQFVFNTQSSRLNVDRIHYSFEASGEFYLVLSNAGGIEGGAVPQGPVKFHIGICGGTPPIVDIDTGGSLE